MEYDIKFIPVPLPAREGEPDLCDREQSSALRATLRLLLRAGVTPAEGSVKPTAGFTFNKVISPSPFALNAPSRE